MSIQTTLNQKQISYCNLVVAGCTCKDAYAQAYPDASDPSAGASRLNANPEVQRYITGLRQDKSMGAIIDKEFVTALILEGIDMAKDKNQPAGVFKGAELLGKHLGMFEHNVNVKHTVTQMGMVQTIDGQVLDISVGEPIEGQQTPTVDTQPQQIAHTPLSPDEVFAPEVNVGEILTADIPEFASVVPPTEFDDEDSI